MTQFQHTLKALLEGRKTETSRIVKPNEYTWICGERTASWHERGAVPLYSQVIAERKTETFMHHRIVWEVGKDYAIEPHRGVRSVGRYRVEAIWRQDVRTLAVEQIKAEGFDSELEFISLWLKMHNPLCHTDDKYFQAWRMTVQVLWETVNWNAPAVRALQIEENALK